MTTPAEEFDNYLRTLSIDTQRYARNGNRETEELRTTPLFSWSVKQAVEKPAPTHELAGESLDTSESNTPPSENNFSNDTSPVEARSSEAFVQYALLGRELPDPHQDSPKDLLDGETPTSTQDSAEETANEIDPLFLNTNAPWSAFICGSQGSGKSHTLSCILEGCLLQSQDLGKLPKPLTGIVFHYDPRAADAVCEAAYLCSAGVRVRVLAVKSSYNRLESTYSRIPGARNNLTVHQLKLLPKHLNVERMLKLMAFNENEGGIPLYMEVIMKILRDMACEPAYENNFDYGEFRRRVDAKIHHGAQTGPMSLRFELLESFIDQTEQKWQKKRREQKTSTSELDIFAPAPGTLTIVDLTDIFVDAASACALFDISLGLFLEQKAQNGRVIALDEAHKYMNASASAANFTESLLSTIRLQRHNASRIVIATQEPTVSPKLLDLCSMTFVHAFTSPDWLVTLRQHIASISPVGGSTDTELKKVFEEIVTLGVGEALLFAPTGRIRVGRNGGVEKLGLGYLKILVRPRLSEDGGRSVVAVRQ